MRQDTYEELKQRWFDLYPQFPNIREEMLKQVIRWEWSTGPRYDPRPFYFKRYTARGNLLRRKPQSTNEADLLYQLGMDGQGRVIVQRFHHGVWESTLYEYRDEFIEETYYQPYAHALRGVSRLYMGRGGKPKHFCSVFLEGNPDEVWVNALQGQMQLTVVQEEYLYVNHLLTHIQRLTWTNERKYLKRGDEEWITEYTLEYDARNRLTSIGYKVNESGRTRTTYRRRERGETLASLQETTQQHLLRAIPETISAKTFSEPLYCLRLSFDFGFDYFPPGLHPGLLSERDKAQTHSNAIQGIDQIWAVSWEDEDLEIDDPETLIACERLQVEIDLHARHRYALKCLYQLAQALNQLDWSQFISVTEDFIVYAWDNEPFPDALRRSGATQKQIQAWRKRGLLY